MPRSAPDFGFEEAAFAQGALCVAGVDEVGRGPLAGPVTAAAVVLDARAIPDGLNDSKQLTHIRRTELAEAIHATAQVSIAHASVEEIDALNILQASCLAMRRALVGLAVPPDLALIDGNRVPQGLPCEAQPIVKGDSKSLSISAASIVAKVCRDRIMVGLAQQHPGYGWEQNAGYPTPQHLEALRNLGVTPHHRRSYKPVHNILYQEKSVTG
ncbi:MAG: ribonuclease HII [Rhodobacter sp.]|nr:ribonuclease HII [Rhodobacter sp.]